MTEWTVVVDLHITEGEVREILSYKHLRAEVFRDPNFELGISDVQEAVLSVLERSKAFTSNKIELVQKVGAQSG